jgi:hypothetical protein
MKHLRESYSVTLIIALALSYPGCDNVDVYGAFVPASAADAGAQPSAAEAGAPSEASPAAANTSAPSGIAMARAVTAMQPVARPTVDSAAGADAAVIEPPADEVFCLSTDDASTSCESARKVAFSRAICSCGDVVGTGMLSTLSADPTGRADVGVDGSLSLRIGRRGAADDEPGVIEGSVLVAGLGPAAISGVDASIRGDLSLAGELTFAGDVHVAGSVYARRAPRGSGLLQIDGDLHRGAERVPTPLSDNVQVGGQVIEGDYASAPACACNAGNLIGLANVIAAAETAQTELLDMSNLTAASSFELRCDRYYVRGISSLSDMTWRVTGHVVVYVAGDFAVGGDMTVELADGAQLDVLVGGNLLVGGAAQFADPERAAAARVYVLGGVDLATVAERGALPPGASAGTDLTFVGNLYAPTAMLQLAPHSQVYGSLFVRQLLVLQSLLVHYDPTVTSAPGASCEK